MNSTTLRFLAFIVAFLVLALVLVESGDDDVPGSGTKVFPSMRSAANDIDRVTVKRWGQDPVAIEKSEGRWVVPARGGYPANVETVREVLLAMAEATVLEPKTARPELHARLGVDSPDNENSKAALVEATAGGETFALVFGNLAQGNYRYARVVDEDQSWLIDQNPDIPAEPGDWLDADIVDIDASSIQAVTITHSDGETIRVSKSAAEDANYEVADIPDGRELSYSTVANGIAGALNDLDLDDVRPAEAGGEATVTEFTTFDGATIVATTTRTDDANWLTLTIVPGDDESESLDAAKARVEGWQYRIADYKANLLTRRWEDILEPVPEEEDE